jgi:TM2 domain-containing membrane protein YozV
MDTTELSPRSRLVALLFCIFFGVFGVHRFYVGKIGTGILMLVTLGGLGIWATIDLILISVGSFRDKENRRLFRWTEPGSV